MQSSRDIICMRDFCDEKNSSQQHKQQNKQLKITKRKMTDSLSENPIGIRLLFI